MKKILIMIVTTSVKTTECSARTDPAGNDHILILVYRHNNVCNHLRALLAPPPPSNHSCGELFGFHNNTRLYRTASITRPTADGGTNFPSRVSGTFGRQYETSGATRKCQTRLELLQQR